MEQATFPPSGPPRPRGDSRRRQGPRPPPDERADRSGTSLATRRKGRKRRMRRLRFFAFLASMALLASGALAAPPEAPWVTRDIGEPYAPGSTDVDANGI